PFPPRRSSDLIGAGIYETVPLVFKNVPNGWTALGVWVAGGLLSLVGALCYAELASAYPRSGGDYVYLTRAYGSWMGFLFGWAQLTVIQTGGLGMLAFNFADYTHRLYWGASTEGKAGTAVFAVGAGIGLTVRNLLGVML